LCAFRVATINLGNFVMPTATPTSTFGQDF
jgi:hypothetical protein